MVPLYLGDDVAVDFSCQRTERGLDRVMRSLSLSHTLSRSHTLTHSHTHTLTHSHLGDDVGVALSCQGAERGLDRIMRHSSIDPEDVVVAPLAHPSPQCVLLSLKRT